MLALATARAVNAARIVMAQAASAAILTVVTGSGQRGPERLGDALIGAGVALFEEAFYHGVRAAEEVLASQGRVAPSLS